MSMEGSAQIDQTQLGAGYGVNEEQDNFFVQSQVWNSCQSSHYVLSSQVGDSSPSSDYGDIRPMDEAELNRQLKLSREDVDIYNTGTLMPIATNHNTCLGVSDQLKKLLATLHEDDDLPEMESAGLSGVTVSKPAFSAAAQEFVPGKAFGAVTVQEFVPGKPFVLSTPSLERDRSDAGSDTRSMSSKVLGGLNTEAPEFVPSWQKGSTAIPAAPQVKVTEKKVWWYRDPQEVVRGPFSTTEMSAWSEKGYFSGGLEIALSDRGPYLPLSSVYPSPERPFWKSIEPREFATRMRQHILASRSGMELGTTADSL